MSQHETKWQKRNLYLRNVSGYLNATEKKNRMGVRFKNNGDMNLEHNHQHV
jgi:hypothetical protein